MYRRRRKAREQLTSEGAGAVQDVKALGASDQAFVLGARSGSGAAAGGHSGMGRAAAARTGTFKVGRAASVPVCTGAFICRN